MTTPSTLPPVRIDAVDAVRGFAIGLMVLDHLLLLALVAGATDDLAIVRSTITRAAMPMFFGCTGYLAALRGRSPSSRRILEVGFWGLLLSATALASGIFPAPDILLAWALLATVAGLIARYPVPVISFCVVATINFPADTWLPGWDGYDPFLLLAWVAIGSLIASDQTWPRFDRFTLSPIWSAIGRRPLPIYIGHVLAIQAIAVLVL